VPNSQFLIQTLDTDEQTPIKPSLTLGGRALPYQGFELEGSMRAEFTWYPGNAVATVQMLGAQEKSSTIKGMWKDRFIRPVTDEGVAVQPDGVARFDGQQVSSVLDLANRVDQMRLSGRLLRVEWSGIIRHGIMLRFKQNWVRIEDMEWEMEFQWTSRGEVQVPPSLPATVTSADFTQNLVNLVNNLHDKLDALHEGFEVIESWVAKVNSYVGMIDDAANAMVDAQKNATLLVMAPQAAAQRALTAAKNIKDAAAGIVTTVESTPPLQLIKSTSPSTLTLGDALLADSYSRDVKVAARALQSQATSQGDDLRSNLDQDVLLASFIARAPMDLREVSQSYYKTPNQWRTLLNYNNFTSSRIEVGAMVLVPKLHIVTGRA
jgi:hypothetical protein